MYLCLVLFLVMELLHWAVDMSRALSRGNNGPDWEVSSLGLFILCAGHGAFSHG